MTPIKKGKYEFKKESLVEVRNKLGISQAKMAELLGVPTNSLSRWEIGATVPDANKLAAFYSIAKENGFTPNFFISGKESKPFRYNLIVIWDFQTLGTPQFMVKQANDSIESELQKRFAGMVPIYKAFTHPSQEQAAKELEELGWRVWVGNQEIHDDIVEQVKSDSGQNPEETIIVLISNDNSFTELVTQLKENGVQVYIMSTQSYNNQLLNQAGQRFGIQWYPMMLDMPRR